MVSAIWFLSICWEQLDRLVPLLLHLSAVVLTARAVRIMARDALELVGADFSDEFDLV
jgi:hypothetical protein